jgi:hypothetical protein
MDRTTTRALQRVDLEQQNHVQWHEPVKKNIVDGCIVYC